MASPGNPFDAMLYELIRQHTRQGENVAMATIVGSRGSTPQKVGARMLVFESGGGAGTVGGGCVEAGIWQEAAAALESTGLVTDRTAKGVAAEFDWDGPRSRIGMSAHRMANLFDVDEKLGFWAFPLQRLAYLPPDAAERFQGRGAPQLLPLAKPRMLRDRIELLCRGLDPDRRFA